jgi:predicted unusual protein kinase regulating ubiquinone biosynthesis (AarF/ABC1/UbiB family)
VARTFRREFGHEPLYFFEEFSKEAVAAASIGQVHKARRGHQHFAVKVQYPGVSESLQSDLAVVKPLALRLFGLRENDVGDYFREVEERLIEETDYELELERSVELSSRCAHIPNVRFPRFFREFSSKKILTSEWIDAPTLDKFADSDASQELRDKIGQALWDFYDYQIHELRLFHADPHPGNFLVSDNKLVPLDFGCTKRIEGEFYHKHFAFLDPGLLSDRASLERSMRDMRLILPDDTEQDARRLIELCSRSVALLAKPFHQECFDFGDPTYLASIRELGEQIECEGFGPSTLRGARGSRHSLYVNRVYFGLYNLLARLRARVKTGQAWKITKV